MKKIDKNRLISKRNQVAYENAVIYFQAHEQNSRRTNKFFKGSKLKAKEQDKIHQMRTHYGSKADVEKIKYSFDQSNTNENSSPQEAYQESRSIQRIQRQRMSLESFRPKLTQYLKQPRRTIRQCNSQFMVSSQSSQIPKFIKNESSRQSIPHFTSSNLEAKTNQYLNLILRKSEQHQEEQLKRFQIQEEQEKIKNAIKKNSNIFMRKMKISLNKNKGKNDQRNRSQQSYYHSDFNIEKNQPRITHKGDLRLEQIHSGGTINFNQKITTEYNNIKLSGTALHVPHGANNMTGDGHGSYGNNRYNKHKKSFSVNQGESFRLRNPVIKQLMDKVKKWEEDEELPNH